MPFEYLAVLHMLNDKFFDVHLTIFSSPVAVRVDTLGTFTFYIKFMMGGFQQKECICSLSVLYLDRWLSNSKLLKFMNPVYYKRRKFSYLRLGRKLQMQVQLNLLIAAVTAFSGDSYAGLGSQARKDAGCIGLLSNDINALIHRQLHQHYTAFYPQVPEVGMEHPTSLFLNGNVGLVAVVIIQRLRSISWTA